MLIGNRFRPWYGSAPTPLHPSQIDFGAPFQYHKDLWTETLNNPGSGGVIEPRAGGIFMQANASPVGCIATIQALQAIEVSSSRRFLLTARIQVDHPPSAKLMFGLWPTESDPFTNRPDNAILIEDPGSGASDDEVFGTTISNGTPSSTAALIGGPGDPIVFDLAILIEGSTFASFYARYAAMQWRSGTLNNNIPSGTLRPSISTQRGSTASYIVVKSFYVTSEDR